MAMGDYEIFADGTYQFGGMKDKYDDIVPAEGDTKLQVTSVVGDVICVGTRENTRVVGAHSVNAEQAGSPAATTDAHTQGGETTIGSDPALAAARGPTEEQKAELAEAIEEGAGAVLVGSVNAEEAAGYIVAQHGFADLNSVVDAVQKRADELKAQSDAEAAKIRQQEATQRQAQPLGANASSVTDGQANTVGTADQGNQQKP